MTTSTARKRYYTPQEVADLFGISLRTVRTMIASGELPAVRIGAKIVRITAEAIDDAAQPYTPPRAGQDGERP